METPASTLEPQPAATTDVVPAAPATEAPASPPAASERPSSFREAFEQVEARNAKTAETAPAAPATSAPASTTAPSATQPAATTPGPIPFAEHSKILTNTREKARAEVTAEFERDYGWAKGVNPQAFQDIKGIATRLATNPIEFYQWLGSQLAAHPTYGHHFQSQVAGRAAANAEPEPDVQIRDDVGNVVGTTYSAKRLAERDNWREQRLKAELGRQIEPLRAAHENALQEATARQISAENNAKADKILDRIDQVLDGRKDLWGKVDELMGADPTLDALDAALQVRKLVIVPSQQQTATAKVAEDMKRKAQGNTANGASSVAIPAPRPRNPKELAAYMRQLDAAT